MIDFNKVPKDLPVSNPLFFAFLIIMDCIDYNIQFNGKYEKGINRNLPVFEYAVNNWTIETEFEEGIPVYDQRKFQVDTVLCAIWKKRPDPKSCNFIWSKYPNDSARKDDKKTDLSWLLPFEIWRSRTAGQLAQIILALTYKRGAKERDEVTNKKIIYLSEIFCFEIVDEISFFYASDANSNQNYGVGATFKLKRPFQECCVQLDDNDLTLSRFQDLGFIFDGCNPELNL